MQHYGSHTPINGLQMYYEIYGSGNPLVLVHGGGSTIQTSFGNIIPLLSSRHRIIAVELQGHGRTSHRNAPASFEQDADDVASLLDYLKISKADFFGFSNGGNTIMQVAIRHPQLINKLVIASAFYKREGMMKGFFEGMANATLADMPPLLRDAYRELNEDPAMLQQMFDNDKRRMLEFKDWKEEDLASIKAPALVVAGDHDVMTNEHTVELARNIPGASLMIFPGTHGAYMGEETTYAAGSKLPENAMQLIEAFLTGNN